MLAQNLDAAIKAVPHFIHHPDLAYVAATSGGDVAEVAQKLAGLQIIYATAKHGNDHSMNMIQSGRHANQIRNLSNAYYAHTMGADGQEPV